MPKTISSLAFMSHVRYLMILLVVLFHAAISYCNIYPGWFVSDSVAHPVLDAYLLLSDVFMLPVLFFIAGFFAIPSFQRKQATGFIIAKLERLGLPFVLCVLFLGPPMMYLHEYQRMAWNISAATYLEFWADYLKSPVSFYVGPIFRLEQFRPFHYWFVSMLLVFFVVFAILYGIKRRLNLRLTSENSPGRTSQLFTNILLLGFGLLTSLGFYWVNSKFPDYRWYTVGTFFTLQPTRVVLYVAYFLLGLYAFTRKWFLENEGPGYLGYWLAAAVFLMAAFYLFCFKGIWIHFRPDTLPYALLRTFLCLSATVAVILFAGRFWNRSSAVDRAFSDNSYIIYLIHMPIVVILQFLLASWKADGAYVVWIKFGLVAILSILLSLVIGAYVIKPVVRLPGRFKKQLQLAPL